MNQNKREQLKAIQDGINTLLIAKWGNQNEERRQDYRQQLADLYRRRDELRAAICQ